MHGKNEREDKRNPLTPQEIGSVLTFGRRGKRIPAWLFPELSPDQK
jgi:hypothetical protein